MANRDPHTGNLLAWLDECKFTMLTSDNCAGSCPARHRLSVYLLLTFVAILVIAPVVSSDTQPRVCTVFVRESAIPSHLKSHGLPLTTPANATAPTALTSTRSHARQFASGIGRPPKPRPISRRLKAAAAAAVPIPPPPPLPRSDTDTDEEEVKTMQTMTAAMSERYKTLVYRDYEQEALPAVTCNQVQADYQGQKKKHGGQIKFRAPRIAMVPRGSPLRIYARVDATGWVEPIAQGLLGVTPGDDVGRRRTCRGGCGRGEFPDFDSRGRRT